MSKKIMVVDNSEMVRNFHCFFLKCKGYEVVSAVNGFDALEKIYTSKVDMIITDIDMPVMDGYSFIEQVRKEKELADIPIIIISTENEENNEKRGLEAGANIYINKPTDPKTLAKSINILFGEKLHVRKI